MISEARTVLGERIAGFIYGTVLVLSAIAAGARAYPDKPAKLVGLVAATCTIFWLSHVYAHTVASSVAHGERLSLTELRRIAHREASLIEAAILPVVALLLGVLGIVSERAAVWGAFAVGLVVLAALGVLVARIERLGRIGTLVAVAVNLALGLALVGLKLTLTH